MPLNLPLEAYRRTERTREWERIAREDPDRPPEYGLAGTAYAKVRKAKEVADNAKAWEDANMVDPIPAVAPDLEP